MSLLLCALAACSETLSMPAQRLDPSFVTGAAAAALQPNGRFALEAAVTAPANQVNESQAKAIASRFVLDMAPSLQRVWSEQHGSAVTTSALRPCDRALYAATPYLSIAGNASELTRRTLGPHWVVPMCDKGQTTLVITFSALALELAVAPRPVPARWERAAIASFGFPPNAAGWMYSPELVTAHLFKETGRRIRSVPVLVMPPMPETPALVRWRIDLEGPVTVTGSISSIARERTTLFGGFGELFATAGTLDRNPQPSSEPPPLTWFDPVSKATVSATLSPLAPASVEIVRRAIP